MTTSAPPPKEKKEEKNSKKPEKEDEMVRTLTDNPLIWSLQSEEDKQLKEELEMLVERLQVFHIDYLIIIYASIAGTRRWFVPCSARGPANVDPYIHVVHDVSAQAAQIPASSLSDSDCYIPEMGWECQQGSRRCIDLISISFLEILGGYLVDPVHDIRRRREERSSFLPKAWICRTDWILGPWIR